MFKLEASALQHRARLQVNPDESDEHVAPLSTIEETMLKYSLK
jgi:hypothetical protein